MKMFEDGPSDRAVLSRGAGSRRELLERERFRDVHIHAIYDEETMLGLGVSTKLNAEWAFLTHLRECGRKAAQVWLSQHYEDPGIRNTPDLSWIFDESLKPANLPEGAEWGSAIKEAAR
jgi:NTE family protein